MTTLRHLQSTLLRNAARQMHSGSMDALGLMATLPSAFVFDIDGVLCRGSKPLPEAIRALSSLYHSDKKTPRLPLAFLTNGGGLTERQRAAQLEQLFGVEIDASQVILSHTPYRSIAPSYHDKPVLIVGRGVSLDAAQQYGFKHAVTPAQIARAMPTSVPFWSQINTSSGYGSSQQNVSMSNRIDYMPKLQCGTETAPIRAVFVFTDPTDWYVDLQIICDVVAGGGVLGRRPNDVPASADPVPVFFSNPDIVWSNEFPAPRFGQGAFAACVDTLYSKLTGSSGLPVKTVFGKPNPPVYRLVEDTLTQQAYALGLIPEEFDKSELKLHRKLPFSAIYAVGDHPPADVRGATQAGAPWISMLVRTGVFSGKENCPVDPADFVVDNVEDAVRAAMNHTRSMRWHSMR